MTERNHNISPLTPDVMRFTTDGEKHTKAYEIIDNYFVSLLEYVGFTKEEMPKYAEIIDRSMVQDAFFNPNPSQRIYSEDKIRILLAFEYPIASAMEMRTVFNNIQIQCANYVNQPDYLNEIKSKLQESRERQMQLKSFQIPDSLNESSIPADEIKYIRED